MRSAVVTGGGLLREAAGGIREGLQQLQMEPETALRRITLEQELEQARREGRWLSDEERRELEAERLALEQTTLAQQQRRRSLMVLLVVSLLLPPLWPLAVALTSHLLFPRTTRRLLLAALTLAGLGTLLLIALIVIALVLWL